MHLCQTGNNSLVRQGAPFNSATADSDDSLITVTRNILLVEINTFTLKVFLSNKGEINCYYNLYK